MISACCSAHITPKLCVAAVIIMAIVVCCELVRTTVQERRQRRRDNELRRWINSNYGNREEKS